MDANIIFNQLLCLCLFHLAFCSEGDLENLASIPDEHRLVAKLFNKDRYDNSVRPVFNSSDYVNISFGFSLIQIMDMVTCFFLYIIIYI